jgi:hypothetical protein
VLPVLAYAIESWYPSQIQLQKTVEKVQKFAARLVTNDYNLSYSQLLAKLKWTPISQLATVQRGLLMHGYLHGNRDLPDEVPVLRNSQRTSARTSHDMQLVPKHYNSKTS